MQCMVCATELLHAANFCPVCGARLAAPPPDGSAATTPGGETPPVVLEPVEEPNVVYLPTAEQTSAEPEPGTVAPNPHAGEYTATTHAVPDPYQPGASLPVEPYQPAPGSYAEELAQTIRQEFGSGPLDVVPPAVATTGSHGPIPTPQQLVPPQPVATNPFGDFFSDGPTAWLGTEDSDEDSIEDVKITSPRIAGTFLALGAIGLLLGAWVVWGIGVVRDAGGAEAAPLLLMAMVLWIWYLNLPRQQQHHALLARHRAMTRLVERTVLPLSARTEGSLTMRRERDRYRAMRDERERRILALGEAAQRSFRSGQLPADLHGPAQRVLAIERQMLAQDARIHNLVSERNQRASSYAEGVHPD